MHALRVPRTPRRSQVRVCEHHADSQSAQGDARRRTSGPSTEHERVMGHVRPRLSASRRLELERARIARPRARQSALIDLRASRKAEVDALDELAHEERLREVVLDSELEAPCLVSD